ncbi:MAG: aminodeoxychorismate synthase component I [Bacteroidales bacterium]|nr:aminodeoxychorismate synthase component I [Bacteroidales bacterium]
MYKIGEIAISKLPDHQARFVELARHYELSAILDSNSHAAGDTPIPYRKYDLIAGYSTGKKDTLQILQLHELEQLGPSNQDWYLGYLSYDLKNQIEDLKSANPDRIQWPPLLFFKPEILFLLFNETLYIHAENADISADGLIKTLLSIEIPALQTRLPELKASITRKTYLEKVRGLQTHLHRGDIYEVNYCMEFSGEGSLDPYSAHRQITAQTPAPFSAFFRYRDLFLLSASPERFLQKDKDLLISQPIKGTAPRNTDPSEDLKNRDFLQTSLKERAENIMITDLVRNDLARIAVKNSVQVEELCGIYAFPHVFQMISTIKARIEKKNMLEIIRATFPMGSMTGAPKIRAMELIEEYEEMKRGLYSGAVGYIGPEMDFDLNVVIRSLQYNAEHQYISYIAGSAITAMADPESEYQECLLKAYAIKQSLSDADNA